jgi:maleate isomerase
MRRVALVVPSSNTVMEVDFYRRLPASATLHTARMLLAETTPQREEEMLDEHLPVALRDLATTRPDITVFGCTSAGALRGNAYEEELIRRVEDATGARTLSVAACVRAAITANDPRRVGVITPYIDALNDKIVESLAADGINIVAIHGLGITDNFAIADVTTTQIVSFATSRLADQRVDLVFASCTNFRAFDARDALRDAMGVPVVTSNHAAYEAVAAHLERLAAA